MTTRARKPKKSKRPSKRERTAYHEAGHAALAIVLRRHIKHVTIRPDEEKGSLGHMHNSPIDGDVEFDLKGRQRRAVEREVQILYAGQLAEKKVSGRFNHAGAGSDNRCAIYLAERCCCMGKELQFFIAWLAARTQNQLDDPDIWAGVEAIARALLEKETLTGTEARRLFEAAREESLCARAGWDLEEHRRQKKEFAELNKRREAEIKAAGKMRAWLRSKTQPETANGD